jgi:hypothetical protein
MKNNAEQFADFVIGQAAIINADLAIGSPSKEYQVKCAEQTLAIDALRARISNPFEGQLDLDRSSIRFTQEGHAEGISTDSGRFARAVQITQSALAHKSAN